jgi:hypothetical protein
MLRGVAPRISVGIHPRKAGSSKVINPSITGCGDGIAFRVIYDDRPVGRLQIKRPFRAPPAIPTVHDEHIQAFAVEQRFGVLRFLVDQVNQRVVRCAFHHAVHQLLVGLGDTTSFTRHAPRNMRCPVPHYSPRFPMNSFGKRNCIAG